MFEKINLLIPFGNFVQNKSLQNFLFLALIQSSTILISIISMPLLLQSIGAEQFGWVNLSFSVIIVFNILVGFGFNLSAPREVAINQSNKAELSQLVSNVFSAKILLAIFSTALILIGAYGLNLFQGYQSVLVFSVFILFSEATFPLWFFQGMEKMKLISIANLFSKLLYLLGIVLFIRNPEQSKWVNFILGVSGFGINILLLIYIHYALDIKFYKPRFQQLFTLLRNTKLLLLSNLATHFSINGALIVLSFFASATTLGLFSLAERISMVLRLFPSMVIHSIFPNASKLLKEDLSAFISFLKKVSFVALTIGLAVSLVVFGLAPLIIQLFSKAELVESISYLRVLAFIPFLACLNILNVVIFLVKGQNNLMFKSSWMMGLFMVSNSIVLTSQYGAIGLCFAMLSTEIVVFLICCILNWMYNRPLILAILKTGKRNTS
ncbi:MAG: oligosaccharide flippase family protein [Bacteroidota bacterium]|jgi:O-antigen/teichoic acid export membrane protein|nr:oligosaccharide flippase family protein [Algoriphagus sp.]